MLMRWSAGAPAWRQRRARGTAAARGWPIAIALLAAALVAACAGPTRSGATLDELTQRMGGPKGGKARVVVFREKGFPGIFDSGWEARLDGIAMGDLKTGTFVYRDPPAGSHELTFERAGDFSRASHQTVVAASGRTYVYRLELNEKGRIVAAMGANAGLAGLFVSSAVAAAKDDRGFFDFILLEGDAARISMEDLRLAP
jgi:hypothetical protein